MSAEESVKSHADTSKFFNTTNTSYHSRCQYESQLQIIVRVCEPAWYELNHETLLDFIVFLHLLIIHHEYDLVLM